MSCPIHDRCTCYGSSLQYTTTMTTTATTATPSGSSQFAPQTNNIFVGYEWAAPLVTTTSAGWYPLESLMIQSPTSHSGQDTLLHSDSHRLHNAHEASSHRNPYHREPHDYEREQKQVPLRSREQLAVEHPYPTPYIQGVSRMALPNNYSEPLVPLFRSHQSGMASGFANYDGLSQFESVVNPDQLTPFDEPPPPYPNSNSLLVSSPLSDIFSQSTLLPTERHLNDDGTITGTASPLAPVPLRHCSLYEVLKEDTPISPAQGTARSGVSSIAHALEPQELQARQAPAARKRVLGNTRGLTIGSTSESALSGGQLSTSISLAPVAAAEPPALPRLPALPPPPSSTRTAATAQSPVSSATPPCAAVVLEQNESVTVVTSSQAHTLAQSIPEVTTDDYDTLPRLRKLPRRVVQLQPALPGSAKEDHQSTASSPLSPVSSRPSSSVGAPATSSSSRDRTSTGTGKRTFDSASNLPLLGRKRPVLRAKLACLFCRRRKIQCRPLPGANQDHTCQQCAKRSRECEYPEMTWRGRGRKRSRSEHEESDDDEEEEELELTPSRSKTRRIT